MIRTIGSLVQEPLNTRCWFFTTSLYTLACISTSIILGTSLSGVGMIVHALMRVVDQRVQLSKESEYVLIGLVAISYALSDFGLFRLPRPRLMNAVPVTWRPYGGALAYGAALGLGITTQIHFGAFYILCIWCIFKGNLLYGAILMGLYGGTRSLVLFPASRYIYSSCANTESFLSQLTVSLETAKAIVAVALIVFGTYLAVAPILCVKPCHEWQGLF
jgi:hypothetical protein